jgi:hypothetical protein
LRITTVSTENNQYLIAASSLRVRYFCRSYPERSHAGAILPLAILAGMVGEFMFYRPVTLIITLFASLVVALHHQSVFAISFHEA